MISRPPTPPQIAYTASTTQPWISLSGATTGTTPASFIITVHPATLAPGTYYGTVNLNAPSASNHGFITVDLIITPFNAVPSGALTAASGSPIATGAGPVAIITSDFNNDGNSDFATANQTDNTVHRNARQWFRRI